MFLKAPATIRRIQDWHSPLHLVGGYGMIIAVSCPIRQPDSVPFMTSQVISDPALGKSGVYWSWNNDTGAFENEVGFRKLPFGGGLRSGCCTD